MVQEYNIVPLPYGPWKTSFHCGVEVYCPLHVVNQHLNDARHWSLVYDIGE